MSATSLRTLKVTSSYGLPTRTPVRMGKQKAFQLSSASPAILPSSNFKKDTLSALYKKLKTTIAPLYNNNVTPLTAEVNKAASTNTYPPFASRGIAMNLSNVGQPQANPCLYVSPHFKDESRLTPYYVSPNFIFRDEELSPQFKEEPRATPFYVSPQFRLRGDPEPKSLPPFVYEIREVGIFIITTSIPTVNAPKPSPIIDDDDDDDPCPLIEMIPKEILDFDYDDWLANLVDAQDPYMHVEE